MPRRFRAVRRLPGHREPLLDLSDYQNDGPDNGHRASTEELLEWQRQRMRVLSEEIQDEIRRRHRAIRRQEQATQRRRHDRRNETHTPSSDEFDPDEEPQLAVVINE